MTKRRRGAEWRTGHAPAPEAPPRDRADDPFDEWERYPATRAEENIGYQKIARYGAPFGDAGVGLLLLAASVNVLRRAGRAVIRLLVR
jgi:hypothetical protein